MTDNHFSNGMFPLRATVADRPLPARFFLCSQPIFREVRRRFGKRVRGNDATRSSKGFKRRARRLHIGFSRYGGTADLQGLGRASGFLSRAIR
jgi:hypothetical protein